ncbi:MULTISPECIES: 3-hydroxybutyryl-CoA dehydrogenase [unclassified Serinicoccus]|uniref:3-hydroxybutyryl-CoA dehydrogenase n=1 Tax=unclassified Serinicoccus TaxID=2643101 RepID=UPI0038531947
MREITTVGVIGLGTMGAGIVEVFARGGLSVVGVETSEELVERGREILRASTDRAVSRGKLDEAGQQEILSRITLTSDLQELADAGLVVEAVPEVMSIKHAVFTALDDIVAPEAVLASNTSSLSITEIAAGTRHPERVVGLHFFNPAPVLRLVEVITTLRTEPDLVDELVALAGRIGKEPVVIGDRAGFVANYLLFGYFVSALRMLEQGHVSREDLDTAMRVGAGLPMGPCTLMDLVGLDVCHHIGDVIYAHSRSPMHAPSSMLHRMVTAGLLGRKSGRGFYTYQRPGSGTVVDDGSADAATAERPPLEAVGVLGAGTVADELVARLREGGYAVTHVPDPAESTDLEQLSGVGLVIEAANADAADATDDDLWERLGQVLTPGAVLSTVNEEAAVALGALSGRPGQAAVMRIHAPTGNGQVVEIGRSSATEEGTVALLREVVTRIGAEPVVCRDRAGLVVDALLMPHLNDAVRMLDEGYAGVDDIDRALRFGLGYPVGPFAMIDRIGADEVLTVCEELSASSGMPAEAVAPSPLLVEHVLLDRTFTG